MGKDMHLINIYLKIHNKQTLTLDDLRYLAMYSPECFEKTCKNVMYNVPESKPIMEPVANKEQELVYKSPQEQDDINPEKAEQVLDNIKNLETNEFPTQNMDAEHVKNLLGNLYMEMLFPHNDKTSSLYFGNEESISSFDAKA